MNKIFKAIPNAITLGNLLMGISGIVFLFREDIFMASLMIILASILDFFDGFFARVLKAYSEIGRQLDSLADLVSFGVLPSLILFILITKNSGSEVLPYVTLSIAAFGAIRLARFNVDENQANHFKGLPIPASALLIGGIGFWTDSNMLLLENLSGNPVFLIAVALILSFFMVSRISFPSLKIKDYTFKSNYPKILLVVFCLVLIALVGLSSLSIIILFYMLYALILNIFSEKMS